MTYLLSAAGFLIAERNTWESRADSAWGASRNWPDGISWETDRNNWYNQANAWYTSRYNDGHAAGYAAADAAESPAPLTYQDVGFNVAGLTASKVLATVTAPRTGYYLMNGYAGISGWGSNQWRVDVYVNGSSVATGHTDWLEASGRHYRTCTARVMVTAGHAMQLVSQLAGGDANAAALNPIGTFFTTFVPTPGYQQ